MGHRIVVWGPMKKTGKHASYTIIVSNAHNIFVNYLEFDIGSMQYSIKGNPVQLPSTGLVRNYTCSAIDPNGEFFYAGTTGGEICIFNIANLIFKAALPVISVFLS
jgi:cilia- and flagella-associated protein 52